MWSRRRPPLICSHSLSRRSCSLRIDDHRQRIVQARMGFYIMYPKMCLKPRFGTQSVDISFFARSPNSSKRSPASGLHASVLGDVTAFCEATFTSRRRGAMHGTQDVGPWLLHRTDDRRELAVMSYAERKAVQLARLYSSVKRVSFGFACWCEDSARRASSVAREERRRRPANS